VVLPVVDLNARLGRERTEANAKHVIVVVKAAERTIGLLVDAVCDILTVTQADIQPTPELARDAHAEFVEGIAIIEQRMVTVLSIDRLIASLVGTPDEIAA
jgi:purine-binding chemotaxis protein CheW